MNRSSQNFNYFYVVTASAAFIYVALRSIWVGLTHDEAITYSILQGETHLLTNSTNHWLNTILCFVTTHLFGNVEWSLRLPNLLAFLVYLWFMKKLLVASDSHWINKTAAFFIAIGNPFILEFFGLARGYGLSMAFLAGALFYLFKLQEDYHQKIYRKFIVCIVLAVYANYSFIYCLGLMQLMAIYRFIKSDKSYQDKKTFWKWTFLEGLVLLPAAINLIRLVSRDQLYFGGDNNIFMDTFFTLGISYFPHPLFSRVGIIIISLMSALNVHAILFSRSLRNLNPIYFLMAGLIIIPTVLHFVAGVKFPIQRTAMYWVPLFTIVIVNVQPTSRIHHFIFSSLSSLTIALMCWSNIKHNNLSHTWTWRMDANIKDVLNEVQKEVKPDEKVTIGIHWIFEPVMNYYRVEHSLGWLEPLHRNGYHDGQYNYYYFFQNERESFNLPCSEEMVKYEMSYSVLLRNCSLK